MLNEFLIPIMESGGKVKTENNVCNEAYDDSNFNVQSQRQVRGFNLSLFYNDRSSTFSKKGLWKRHSHNPLTSVDCAALSQKVVR